MLFDAFGRDGIRALGWLIKGIEMAELVNLRTARKRASRQQDDARAGANRLAYGQPTHIREREAALQEKAARVHDQHRIERGDDR